MSAAISRRGGRGRSGRSKGRALERLADERITALLGDAPRTREMLIEHLHRIQDSDGGLSASMIAALAAQMKLSQAEVYEVASFYHHFDLIGDTGGKPQMATVRICESVVCAMHDAHGLTAALTTRVGAKVRIQQVPCVGRCDRAPVAVVGQRPVERATPARVEAAIASQQLDCPLPAAIPLETARLAGGYRLLERLIADRVDPARVFEQLELSGLRGMGGAGFPAGRKWRIVAAQPGPRYLVVNADEGEPGTFKDRDCLERDPHRMLEGMLIAAWAVGCERCVIYLRDEYPGVRAMLEREIAALREAGSLFGAWALPEIVLRRGAGAYVCGEESALIESIEGKRGMPRLRPPYIAERGLFGRPTLAHNVETLWWVAPILGQGDAAFAAHGRRGRRGLRSFSVSGRVADPGVKLAPAGISLRELIDEHAGGMAPGHQLHAFLPGGASGGILPAALADEPLDFDTLQPHGAFIGSAAVVVLSQHDDIAEIALNLMRFFRDESCGQCTPCRVGTDKAVVLMSRAHWDESLLAELAQTMVDASICGLGQAAPNPVLTTMRYFPQALRRRALKS